MTIIRKFREKTHLRSRDLGMVTAISLYVPIESVSRENPRRVEFLFLKNPKTEKLISQYWKGTLRIDPKIYFNQLRTIKAYLYDGQNYNGQQGAR